MDGRALILTCFERDAVQRSTLSEEQLDALYTCDEIIGKGEYGTIFSALDCTRNCRVAIKKQILPAAEVGGYVVRELEVLLNVQHCNIIKPIAVVFTLTEVWTVLPLMQQDLSHWARTVDIRTRIKMWPSIAGQLLSALKQVHANNVIHYDIKTANALIDNNQVYLADFGICSTMPGEYQGEMCTLCYRPPEIIILQETARVDASCYTDKVDVWALGCTLLEVLLGRCPFWKHKGTARYVLATQLEATGIMTAYEASRVTSGTDFPRLSDLERPAALAQNEYFSPLWAKFIPVLRAMLVPDPKKRFSVDEIMTAFSYMFDSYNTKPNLIQYPQPSLSRSRYVFADKLISNFLVGRADIATTFGAYEHIKNISANLLAYVLANFCHRGTDELRCLSFACLSVSMKYYYPAIYGELLLKLLNPISISLTLCKYYEKLILWKIGKFNLQSFEHAG